MGGTTVTDGWDDIERNHPINFLTATSHGAFSEGTLKLGSNEHEDAAKLKELICQV